MFKEWYGRLNDKMKGIMWVTVYIAGIFFAAVILNCFFYSPLIVVGVSMNPSLEDNDLVIIDKISYKIGDPERYDMVLFPYKYDNNTNFIKRVVGLPGEKVEVRDGIIYINDEKLEEFYGVYDQSVTARFNNYGPIVLEADEYFVMGDNRNHSDDSRSNDVGPIKENDIIGKICFRLWPFESIGSLKYQ